MTATRLGPIAIAVLLVAVSRPAPPAFAQSATSGERIAFEVASVKPNKSGARAININTYPGGPLARDTAGNFLITGQVADAVAAHTASDIPVSAAGCGASRFSGVMDNTDVFFRIMRAVAGGGDDDRDRGCDDDRTWDDRCGRGKDKYGRDRR